MLITFNDIAACIPAVVVGLGATFMPLRMFCSNFSPLIYDKLLPLHDRFYSL